MPSMIMTNRGVGRYNKRFVGFSNSLDVSLDNGTMSAPNYQQKTLYRYIISNSDIFILFNQDDEEKLA